MSNNESEQRQNAKIAKMKTVGVILLIAIGLPILFFGACILLLNTSG
jgi:hypothetical protein